VATRSGHWFVYSLIFTVYDPGDEADMTARIYRLKGSPTTWRDCPRTPNLRGDYEKVRMNGTGRPMEAHWRQRPDRSQQVNHQSIMRLERIMQGQRLDPGIYRVRIRGTYSGFGSDQADFEFGVMSHDASLGPRPRQ
jgi:hypothetical protein